MIGASNSGMPRMWLSTTSANSTVSKCPKCLAAPRTKPDPAFHYLKVFEMCQAQNVTSWMIFANIIKFAKNKDFSRARPPVCASSTVQLEDLSPDAGHAGHGVQVTWTLRWHLRKGAKKRLIGEDDRILRDIAGQHWFLALNSSASLEILKNDIDSKHSRRLFLTGKCWIVIFMVSKCIQTRSLWGPESCNWNCPRFPKFWQVATCWCIVTILDCGVLDCTWSSWDHLEIIQRSSWPKLRRVPAQFQSSSGCSTWHFYSSVVISGPVHSSDLSYMRTARATTCHDLPRRATTCHDALRSRMSRSNQVLFGRARLANRRPALMPLYEESGTEETNRDLRNTFVIHTTFVWFTVNRCQQMSTVLHAWQCGVASEQALSRSSLSKSPIARRNSFVLSPSDSHKLGYVQPFRPGSVPNCRAGCSGNFQTLVIVVIVLEGWSRCRSFHGRSGGMAWPDYHKICKVMIWQHYIYTFAHMHNLCIYIYMYLYLSITLVHICVNIYD